MTSDLTIKLIFSGIAFALGLAACTGYRKMHKLVQERGARRSDTRRLPSYTRKWLTEYYLRRDRLQDLFLLEVDGQRRFVPFLVKPEWLACPPEEKLIIQSLPHHRSHVSINKEVLRRRQQYLVDIRDGTPWNDLHACAASVEHSETGPKIKVIVAEYYQYLSMCGALEDETYAAARGRGRNRGTPIRDRTLADVDIAALGRLGAHAMGMTVAMVYETKGTITVLIQERSQAVSIYRGALGVVPMFGCQTTDLSEQTEVSLKHNFLREVYEELYGGTAVKYGDPHIEPCWFLEDPSMSRLVTAMDESELSLDILGFGFDALNGQLIIGGVAAFKNSDFIRRELPRMTGNWEVRRIQPWDLFGKKLSSALLDGEFAPACAFTLALTREYVRDLYG